jgi:hypothetical protein
MSVGLCIHELILPKFVIGLSIHEPLPPTKNIVSWSIHEPLLPKFIFMHTIEIPFKYLTYRHKQFKCFYQSFSKICSSFRSNIFDFLQHSSLIRSTGMYKCVICTTFICIGRLIWKLNIIIVKVIVRSFHITQETWVHPLFLVGFVLLDLWFYVYIL